MVNNEVEGYVKKAKNLSLYWINRSGQKVSVHKRCLTSWSPQKEKWGISVPAILGVGRRTGKYVNEKGCVRQAARRIQREGWVDIGLGEFSLFFVPKSTISRGLRSTVSPRPLYFRF